MVRGLYTAAAGAIVAQSNVDVIANNLANVNTAGFKRTLMQIEAQPRRELFRDQVDPGRVSGSRTDGVPTHTPVGALGSGSRIFDTPANFEQGPIEQTGNAMDVALSGPGFLAVRDARGVVRYARGGSFVQNAKNELITTGGENVMGANGRPVTLAPQTNVSIDSAGRISSNGQPVAQLAVFEFRNLTTLRPEGANKFINGGAAPRPATGTSVLQGAQEKSNAQVIPAMVSLIANQRWFDLNEKMIQAQDDAVGTAITTVGKTTP